MKKKLCIFEESFLQELYVSVSNEEEIELFREFEWFEEEAIFTYKGTCFIPFSRIIEDD